MLRINFVVQWAQPVCCRVLIVAAHAAPNFVMLLVVLRAAGLVPFVSAPRISMFALLSPQSDIFCP